jgi:hypothetical protein
MTFRYRLRGYFLSALALALMFDLWLCYTVPMAMVALAVISFYDFLTAHRIAKTT